ncbi:NUDIX hydrolase [filamentous cyanobacterium LEGE 11480]|uniref:NUDIX hydrolase n=1 Tax=Romeriopsis navalis LEGE 11480 TaxID=2777977 RepID=A0A928VQ33_9CYAN|nr:NUDIX hydrolase [Romeriopsis navalis]MBE9030024.1 NUDIX hydrolase [Romeriopsis navalis LEGE 11480]
MAYRNPAPTVDIIVEMLDRPDRPIILIERMFEPLGWAIPGGFIDYGESAETAGKREAMEEIGLEIELVELLGVYSAPDRDPRQHTLSTVYIATATGTPKAGDDAKQAHVLNLWEIPKNLCFDHGKIVADYLKYRYYQQRPILGK